MRYGGGKGFARIFTILARGYLFHNADGSLKDGDPRERIEYARRALCAWCSMPDKKKSATSKIANLNILAKQSHRVANKETSANITRVLGVGTADWQFKTCFAEYHEKFPELVDEDGAGWYYRHVHAIAEYYIAYKPYDSDWCVLPVTNIEAYSVALRSISSI